MFDWGCSSERGWGNFRSIIEEYIWWGWKKGYGIMFYYLMMVMFYVENDVYFRNLFWVEIWFYVGYGKINGNVNEIFLILIYIK